MNIMLEYADKLVHYCENNLCEFCRFKFNGDCVFKYCNLLYSITNMDTPSKPFVVLKDEIEAIISLMGLASECEKTPCHNCPLQLNGRCIMEQKKAPEKIREDLDAAKKLWYKERNEKIAESLEILYDTCRDHGTCKECPLKLDGDCFKQHCIGRWGEVADKLREDVK